jgi:hypothetical protein
MEPWQTERIKLIDAHKHDRPLQVYTLAEAVIDVVERVIQQDRQVIKRQPIRERE